MQWSIYQIGLQACHSLKNESLKSLAKHKENTTWMPRLQTNMSTTEVLVQAEKPELKLVACLFQSFSSPT